MFYFFQELQEKKQTKLFDTMASAKVWQHHLDKAHAELWHTVILELVVQAAIRSV